MYPQYFEQLHREEAKHCEWKLLDEALARRTNKGTHDGATLRKAIGQLLIQAGTKIAGDETHVQRRSRDKRDT